MNKKLIALAVAGAMTGAVSVATAAEVSGFAAFTYNLSDDAGDDLGADADGSLANDIIGTFSGTTVKGATTTTGGYGEVDIIADAVRVDLDIDSTGALMLEQAKIMVDVAGVALTIGAMNNPVGVESQDITDRTFTQTGVIFDYLHDANATNVVGAMVAFEAGPAEVHVGMVNDINGADEERSFILEASADVMDGLNVGLGVITQSDGTASQSDSTMISFDADYTMGALNLNAEFLSAGMLDSALEFGAGYDLGNGLIVAGRYGQLTESLNGFNQTQITANATYALNDDVDVRIEYLATDSGAANPVTRARVTADFIAKF